MRGMAAFFVVRRAAGSPRPGLDLVQQAPQRGVTRGVVAEAASRGAAFLPQQAAQRGEPLLARGAEEGTQRRLLPGDHRFRVFLAHGADGATVVVCCHGHGLKAGGQYLSVATLSDKIPTIDGLRPVVDWLQVFVIAV